MKTHVNANSVMNSAILTLKAIMAREYANGEALYSRTMDEPTTDLWLRSRARFDAYETALACFIGTFKARDVRNDIVGL